MSGPASGRVMTGQFQQIVLFVAATVHLVRRHSDMTKQTN